MHIAFYDHSSYLHCRDYEQLALKYISTVIAVEKSLCDMPVFLKEVMAALSSKEVALHTRSRKYSVYPISDAAEYLQRPPLCSTARHRPPRTKPAIQAVPRCAWHPPLNPEMLGTGGDFPLAVLLHLAARLPAFAPMLRSPDHEPIRRFPASGTGKRQAK